MGCKLGRDIDRDRRKLEWSGQIDGAITAQVVVHERRLGVQQRRHLRLASHDGWRNLFVRIWFIDDHWYCFRHRRVDHDRRDGVRFDCRLLNDNRWEYWLWLGTG